MGEMTSEGLSPRVRVSTLLLPDHWGHGISGLCDVSEAAVKGTSTASCCVCELLPPVPNGPCMLPLPSVNHWGILRCQGDDG